MSAYSSSRWARSARDPYPTIRESLSPDYAELSPEAIEQLVESMYDDLSAEDLENFFNTLKKVGGTAAKLGAKALPGVIGGATTGAALGPWGALAGGIAGGALSLASGSGGAGGAAKAGRGRGRAGGARRKPGRAARRPAGGIRQAVTQAVAGSPAAAQLLRTITRPEVTQSLMSMALGGAGNNNVRIGNASVPTGAITNLLGRLLERAEQELHENTAGQTSGTPRYLLDDDGEFLVDPMDAEARADLMLELFAEADELDDEDRWEHQNHQYATEGDDEWEDEEVVEDDEAAEDDEVRYVLEQAYLGVED